MTEMFTIVCDAHNDLVTVARWEVPLLVQAIHDPHDARSLLYLDGLQVRAGGRTAAFGGLDRAGTSVDRELRLQTQGSLRGRVRLHCRCGLNVVRDWGEVAPQIGRLLDAGVSQLSLLGIQRI